MAAEFLIEVVEGPGSGRQVALGQPLVVGREDTADLVLDDPQVSRRHARLTPTDYGAGVEDLGSRNGTFVNGAQIHTAVGAQPGDVIAVGAVALELRAQAELAERPSAVRPVPPALVAAAREPDYLEPIPSAPSERIPGPEERLAAYFDARTKAQARLAPVAIFLLVALVVIVYLAVR
jgi:pSer/pThr/pTyr-binding forkhead associated (FHA) protein